MGIAILSKYRLNIRHAANELNWQIEDICSEGLKLKQQLVRQFEDADLRTYQLCFAIKTHPKTGLQGSVTLKKDQHGLYDILHTLDFNPNSKEEVIYARQVKPQSLSKKLITLCNKFYDKQRVPILSSTIVLPESPQEEVIIYQCGNCFTRYDKQYGDTTNGIEKGVEFELIDMYVCPVCESPKSEFSVC
jgi:rubredoxin